MKSLETRFTPAPWTWHTSNSWRRLKRDDLGKSQNVLEPYVCRDGHPDLIITPDDMALIGAAPKLYEALKDVLRIASAASIGVTGNQARIARAEAVLAEARGEPTL